MTWQVITGDCLEVMPTLADSSVDLVLTDPPYYKVKNLPWDRQWDTPAKFLEWLDAVLAEFYRVLKPNGSLYLFASPRMAARVEVLTGERFNVLSNIVWVKPDPNSELNRGAGRSGQASKEALRQWFPLQERIIFAEHYGADGYAKGEAGYSAKCDELRGFVFEPLRAYLDGERQRAGVSKSAANKLFNGPNVGQYWWQVRNFQLPTAENYEILREGLSRLNHGGEYLRREYEDLRREYEDLRRPFSVTADVPYTDVWTFPTVQSYPGKHPAEKPQALLRHIIVASSKPGAVVLDAFAGSGSTGTAALDMGRKFIGIEKDNAWAEYSRERISKAEQQARQLAMPLGVGAID